MRIPLVLLECSDWVADEETLLEWKRFEAFYGRALTVTERMMCLPGDVLVALAVNAAGTRFRFSAMDAYLLKLMHARESVSRLAAKEVADGR